MARAMRRKNVAARLTWVIRRRGDGLIEREIKRRGAMHRIVITRATIALRDWVARRVKRIKRAPRRRGEGEKKHRLLRRPSTSLRASRNDEGGGRKNMTMRARARKAPQKLGSSQVETRRSWCGSQPEVV